MMNVDIKAGIVKPIAAHVVEAKNIESAFRYMATGTHIGKILLKLRETPETAESLPISVLPKVFCDFNGTFVLVGEMDDFSLELADWLVLRGCKKLSFSTGKGISNAYQAYRIK